MGPDGTDIGDKLHGVDRNRGINRGPESTSEYGSTTGTGTTGAGHHYGRDASAVGGAAAVGEHEHRKHEHSGTNEYPSTTGQTSGTTGTYSNNDTNTTSNTSGHHLGRDTASLGGAAAVGEHEHRKHDGHNRLHKDPPASHPASQGGMTKDSQYIEPGTGRTTDPTDNYGTSTTGIGTSVPASGSERRNMVGHGEERLDHDTGVGNAPNTMSTNY